MTKKPAGDGRAGHWNEVVAKVSNHGAGVGSAGRAPEDTARSLSDEFYSHPSSLEAMTALGASFWQSYRK